MSPFRSYMSSSKRRSSDHAVDYRNGVEGFRLIEIPFSPLHACNEQDLMWDIHANPAATEYHQQEFEFCTIAPRDYISSTNLFQLWRSILIFPLTKNWEQGKMFYPMCPKGHFYVLIFLTHKLGRFLELMLHYKIAPHWFSIFHICPKFCRFGIQHLWYVDDKTQFSECARMIWNYDGCETLCPPTNQCNLIFTILHLPHDYTPHCKEQPYHGPLSLHAKTLLLHSSHPKLLPYPKVSFVIT